ncbi:propionyl-CoA synthetase [Limimaricola soesokkakensis]|uniref:Acetyl-coenzyme A synthetase n=1 Tax=Limimaricola soesokkakensis TaxID=1343159 RepID=A0A1X6YW25_9RHOB|nr:AMP-binding protein [Limimaricola soesokkakensis]PSK87671.1 propionyl-CoA synthetase [Limimaricola soesokkakensis]SLN32944.1 Acetyl-coenzyme A synthetase [Limimaricola soesokkakensis]
MTYADVYESWRSDPEGFWMGAARAIDWHRFPSRALSEEADPVPLWYPDGMVNGCHNALDRHVAEGRTHDVAIIHDSPVTESRTEITYGELLGRVARLAGALKARGVTKGDRVVIYMPMIPEALEAMLACARIGAIHCVVFGGFAARELAVRIDDCKPKAILAGSCGIEPHRVVAYKPLLDAALIEAEHKPEFCVILQRPQAMAGIEHGRDIEWHDFQEEAEPADCVPVEANHPAYILYTSGTTGKPKGVVRPTGGHLVALHWTMKNVYATDPGEVFWAASDVGWVVGHSYICYGPLIHGNTTLIYEGKPVGTPDAGAFWRVIARNKVRTFFTAPTALRAIKREDPEGRMARDHDLSGLRAIYLAGERADPDTVAWAREITNVPVYDHWWQTETGYTITGNPVGIEPLPVKDGSSTVPMPGYDIRILDETGQEKPRGTLGAVAIRLPLPPGTLIGIWGDEARFRRSYLSAYPGFYATGDAGMIDEDGYVSILSRTDDVINVAGHRLSTGGMEEVLADHPDVAECAVIGVADPLKGQLPMGFLCLNRTCARPPEEILREAVDLVRERIGPVAAFRLAVVVERLPKTRSGKILRSTMAKLADGEDFAMPATIDDPAILDELRAAIAPLGYGVPREAVS